MTRGYNGGKRGWLTNQGDYGNEGYSFELICKARFDTNAHSCDIDQLKGDM